MLRKHLRTLLSLGALLALAQSTACLPGVSERGRSDSGDQSIITSLEGISPEDQARTGLGFYLVCGEFRETGTKIDKNGDSLIRFSADRIAPDALCALEIRAPEDGSFNSDDYEWYGRKSGNEDKGLMYASNLATPKDGRLELKIYVLYARKSSAASFVAEVRGELELGDRDTKPASAGPPQLECDGEFRRPGEYQSLDGKEVRFTFRLSANEAQDKVCNKLALRAVVDGKELQWEAAVEIKLGAPKPGDTLKFPAADAAPYVLKKISMQPDPNSVEVSTNPGGPCLRYVQGEGCLDHPAQSLADAAASQNYVWLKVEGLNANGIREAYIVGAGERGFNTTAARAITRDELQASLTEPAPRKWNWYRLGTYPDPRDLAFTVDFIRGESKKGDALEPSTLRGYTVLNLAETWVHGFYEAASLEDLNRRNAARWYVTINIKKDGAKVATVIVSDQFKYLVSDSPIATLADGSKALFDLLSFQEKRSDLGQGWAIWWTAGSLGADPTCELDARYLATEYGRRHLGDFAIMGGDATLDACAISRERFDQLYGSGHELALDKIMIWDWHKLSQVSP